MGDIQLALYNRRGVLEVEVIRAKGLLPKPGSKILPGKHFVFGWNVHIYFAWNQAWKTEVGRGGGEGMRILVLTENAFFVSSLIYSLRPQCNKNDQKHGGGVQDSGPILFSFFAERSFSCCLKPFIYFCRQGLVNSSIASSFFSFCNEIITQSWGVSVYHHTASSSLHLRVPFSFNIACEHALIISASAFLAREKMSYERSELVRGLQGVWHW